MLEFFGKFIREDIPIKPLKAHDGDTFTCQIPGVKYQVLAYDLLVRVAGIDTPELRGPYPKTAQQALSVGSFLLFRAKKVILKGPGRDKYFRLNSVVLCDKTDYAEYLLSKKLALPYTGEGPKPVPTGDVLDYWNSLESAQNLGKKLF